MSGLPAAAWLRLLGPRRWLPGQVAAWLAAVGGALDPSRNPFLAAELRAQARRHFLPRNLLFLTLGLSALLLYLLKVAGLPSAADHLSFQRFLQFQLVTALAAVHAWLIFHASSSRAREAAQREEADRMWEMLLVTPLSPAEIVVYKSVYPFVYAGLIALAGLPLYLLAAAISGIPPGQLLMLYGVYGLLAVRWVAPLQPPPPGRSRRARRPRPAAPSLGSLLIWLWPLAWVGQPLRPVSPLASAFVLTWPVVAAELLLLPFRFFRFSLPPLAALVLVGPLVCALHLRWAARRLASHAAEAAPPEAPRLRRVAIAVAGLLAVGYSWPRLVEAGALGLGVRGNRSPGESVAALGWVLMALWWLVFGVGGLLQLAAERSEADGGGRPRFGAGWLTAAGGEGPLTEGWGLVAAPLLVLAMAIALGGRLPPLSSMAWLGRTVVVATGAALLTGELAVWFRKALRGSAADVVVIGLLVMLLIVAPVTLLFWPDTITLRIAALSPAMGFLALLPPPAALSPAALGPLPPWWLSPALNTGAAALLGVRRRQQQRRPEVMAVRRPGEGWLSRGAAWLAAYSDHPVLVKELRTGARRREWRQGFTVGSALALLLLMLAVYSPDTVTGFVEGLPVRFFPIAGSGPGDPGLAGIRLFLASVMVLVVLGLSGVMIFGAPVLGAGSFSHERRKGTLGFLLVTPLGEREIVLGKLLGLLAPLLLAIAASFPLATAAALLSGSVAVLTACWFAYGWLLIACLSGGAIGMLASLLRTGGEDPQGPALLAVLAIQSLKLYAVARLQYELTGRSWLENKLAITAWYVVPLVVMEAVPGLAALAACEAVLTRLRRLDLRATTEK